MTASRSPVRSRAVSLDSVAMQMSVADNVAVAKLAIPKGTVIRDHGREIEIIDTIPQGHRFSLRDIVKGEPVLQYGYPFGTAPGIKKGRLIHAQNVAVYRNENYRKMLNAAAPQRRAGALRNTNAKPVKDRTFPGYIRSDGKVGTRNYYLIVPTSLCASDIAVKTADALRRDTSLKKRYRHIDGIVAAAHTEGCGCNDGEIIDRLLLTLKNTMLHPNVGGVLVVDLGCEKTNHKVVSKYFGDLSRYGKPVDFVSIQTVGGTGKALAAAEKIVRSRLSKVNSVKRQAVSIKHLVLGTECGASDSFSGITANPLIGATVDKVIGSGGAAILSETPEMIGAEAILLGRMSSRKVAQKFIHGMEYYKSLAKKLGVSMEGNFVAGNVEGGLVNLSLKSLGAVLKGGSSAIVDFIDYAERIKHPGLTIMNGPGNDLESMTGIVASGATIILFSTGMGTTEGNAIVPVIKISTRTETFRKMPEDMDFDAGSLLDDNITFESLSDTLLEKVLSVAAGEQTWAEKWDKRSFQIWTAGKLSL